MPLVSISETHLSVCTHVCGLQHPTADLRQGFSPPSHLCLVVYMYQITLCDTQHPFCDADFSALGGKK